ncbi:MAG: hypothetical protein QHJ73_09685, partial [Armatimonadota bacterium]|nr:hypothetical protein [Armatimonadota bacterium]
MKRPLWITALAVIALLAAAGNACASWESYFQVRATAPEDRKAYLSLRRLKLTGKGALGPSARY